MALLPPFTDSGVRLRSVLLTASHTGSQSGLSHPCLRKSHQLGEASKHPGVGDRLQRQRKGGVLTAVAPRHTVLMLTGRAAPHYRSHARAAHPTLMSGRLGAELGWGPLGGAHRARGALDFLPGWL